MACARRDARDGANPRLHQAVAHGAVEFESRAGGGAVAYDSHFTTLTEAVAPMRKKLRIGLIQAHPYRESAAQRRPS
jgi:hypothetical protein